MDEEAKLKAAQLQEEYKLLINRWDDFDRRALTIKGWTAVGMFVAAANLDRGAYVAYLSAIITLAMWLTEAFWRSWQWLDDDRLKDVEAGFAASSLATKTPFQIRKSARKALYRHYRNSGMWAIAPRWLRKRPTWKIVVSTLQHARSPHVLFPYWVFIPSVLAYRWL